MSMMNSETNSNCDAKKEANSDYYVMKQIRQIQSDRNQMNKAQKKELQALNLVRQGIHCDASMSEIIEKDKECSKLKSKTWKQLEMYLKWQAIERFLGENNIKQENYSKYEEALVKQKMEKIEFDSKTQKILKLNYNDL